MVVGHASTTFWLLSAMLFLTLMGKVYTPASTVPLVKTMEGSLEKIPLPDEKAIQLLFWLEGQGGKEAEGGRVCDPGVENFPSWREKEEEETEEEGIKVLEEGEDEGPLVHFKEEEEEEEEEGEEEEEVVLLRTGKEEEEEETEEALDKGGREEEGGMEEEGGREEDNTVSLSYFVSSFQYPTLTFPLPRRNVWYAAHFDFNRVSIPVAGIMKNPVPSSWWGRKVQVSSVATVYWHLCISPEPCAPGSPMSILQGTNKKSKASADQGDVGRVLVVLLGAACGVLLPACLGLLAMVITLRRRSSPNATPRHTPHACPCRTSPQRRYSHGL